MVARTRKNRKAEVASWTIGEIFFQDTPLFKLSELCTCHLKLRLPRCAPVTPPVDSYNPQHGKELTMKGVARRRQTQAQNSSSTSPTMTDMGSDVIAPQKPNTQALSDVFARLECELNDFQISAQTAKARAAALVTADQDITAAKRLMLSTLRRRNMLAPISVLPAEILSRIFHLTAFSEQPYSLGWVHVTHVCRRWRQVTLDDSTLWTRFSTSPRNKDWITERLSRARNAPLVVELDGSMSEATLSLFTPHISHTRELYLHKWHSLHSEIVQEINIQTAPALERLEISVSNSSLSFIEHPFFNGPLPKLRIFCVSELLFPWSLVPRGRLTQLEVTQNEYAFITPVSPRDELNRLIDLLADCPALEVLTLENCLPAMLSKPLGGQTIHLPRLSRLSLGGSSSHVTNLLRMLKLPPSTILRLNCKSENTATHSNHDILPFLSAHFNDPTPVKFRSFNITLDSDIGECLIEIAASSSLPTSPILHTDVIQRDSDAELSLSFHDIAILGDRVDILRRACDVLSLSNIVFLSVYFPRRDQFINWSDIFRHCTEVTTVRVYGRGAIGLVQALTPPKRANTTAGEKGQKRNGGDGGGDAWAQATDDDDDNDAPGFVDMPIFPKLTSLLLELLYFTDDVPASDDIYHLILDTIQWRKANETPLTTLCIDRCVIGEKWAQELEKVVPDFRWDHDKGNDDAEEVRYPDEYDFNFDDYRGDGYGDDNGDYY